MGFGGPIGTKRGVGGLRHRVTVRSPVRTRTPGGTGQSRVTGWTDEATVWASVEEVGGRETTRHEQQVPEATHVVEVRGGPAVKHDWSILWGSRVLQVVRAPGGGSGIANVLVIFCKELTPSTGAT